MNNQRKFETALGDIGYVFDRRNAKGIRFWIHEETGTEIKTVNGMGDSAIKSALDQAKRSIGLSTSDNKRHPQEIRVRMRDAARLTAERARADFERLRAQEGSAEFRAAVAAIEDAERRFRYWDQLMRSAA